MIVLLRCLIDRGSVKSDSLFCSLLGDLPCHVSPVLKGGSLSKHQVKTGGQTHCSGGGTIVSERSEVINRGHSGIQVEERHGLLVSELPVA